jgi:hypothetical protein
MTLTLVRGTPITPRSPSWCRTLHAWRTELLAHFDHPHITNGPTENLDSK